MSGPDTEQGDPSLEESAPRTRRDSLRKKRAARLLVSGEEPTGPKALRRAGFSEPTIKNRNMNNLSDRELVLADLRAGHIDARSLQKSALATLASIAEDEDQAPAVRVGSANALLSRLSESGLVDEIGADEPTPAQTRYYEARFRVRDALSAVRGFALARREGSERALRHLWRSIARNLEIGEREWPNVMYVGRGNSFWRHEGRLRYGDSAWLDSVRIPIKPRPDLDTRREYPTRSWPLPPEVDPRCVSTPPPLCQSNMSRRAWLELHGEREPERGGPIIDVRPEVDA